MSGVMPMRDCPVEQVDNAMKGNYRTLAYLKMLLSCQSWLYKTGKRAALWPLPPPIPEYFYLLFIAAELILRR